MTYIPGIVPAFEFDTEHRDFAACLKNNTIDFFGYNIEQEKLAFALHGLPLIFTWFCDYVREK